VELSLRPASMVLKPKTPSMLPKSAMARPSSMGQGPMDSLGGQGGPVQMMHQKEANILIKQAPADTGKAAKKKAAAAQANKGPTREEVFAKVNSILDVLFKPHELDKIDELKIEENDVGEGGAGDKNDEDSSAAAASDRLAEALSSWVDEGWLPAKMTQTAVTQVYTSLMGRPERNERQLIRSFLVRVIAAGKIDGTHCKEAFIKSVNTADRSDATAASASQILAEMAAWKITEKLATLDEVADCLSGLTLSSPVLRKVLFLAMSLLAESAGQASVLQMYKECRSLQLKDHLDEEERKDETKMAQVLSQHKLSFLMPMLAIRQDMTAHLADAGGNPDSLLKWIEGNVGCEFLKAEDFIVTLLCVVLNHISSFEGSDLTEKDRLEAFRTLLRNFVGQDDKRLQLTAVYALQVWAHSQGFPNGVLLRAFVNCYELDIIDEHAFLQWKEDVNDFYPGKGQALFQVNKWLNWLEEAESDSEEDDE